MLGRIPASRLYAPGLAILGIYPDVNFTGAGQGLNFTSQAPNETPRREDLLRMDFQATDNWRVTGRYMKTKEDILQAYGTTWAGNGSDQLPTPTLFLHPGSNYMLSATGVINNTTSLELSWGRAANSLNYDLQLDKLFRAQRGGGRAAVPLPGRGTGRLRAVVPVPRRPHRQRRPVPDRSRRVHQREHHPRRRREPDEGDGLARCSRRASTTRTASSRRASSAPSTASIVFNDDANNPFDTGYGYANAATGVFRDYTQTNKFAIPEWRYHNVEFYAQDNWKAGSKLTIDYGVRFYWLSPQWDETLQASNFLPDDFDASNAARLYRPVCIGASPCSGNDRRGMDPRLVTQGVTPTLANTVEGRFVGRLTPDSNRFNGAFQAGQGIEDQLQDGATFKVSPRVGVVYDMTGKGEMIVRGGWGIFYDRPQGNMVFDMIANAPGVLNSSVQWGRLQDLSTGGTGGDPNPVLGLNPTVFDFEPPKVTQWNVGFQRKLFHNFMYDLAYVGSKSDDLLRQVQINAVPRGATFLAAEPGSDARAEHDAGRQRAPDGPAAALPGLRRHPHVGVQRLLELPLAADGHQPPLRRRHDVLVLLRVEQDAGHQQQRRLGRPAERVGRRGPSPRLLATSTPIVRTTSWRTSSTSCRSSRTATAWCRGSSATGRCRASTAGPADGRRASALTSRASARRT